MTTESNFPTATFQRLGIGSKFSRYFFQPMSGKAKSNRTLYAGFFPLFEQFSDNC